MRARATSPRTGSARSSRTLAEGTHEPGSNAQKIGDLFTSFMDEERVEALGAEPVRARPRDGRRAARPRPPWSAFVGGLERRGGGGFFGAYVNTDDRDSDRYIVNIVQGGIGLPDESYYREDKFAEIRDGLRRPRRHGASRWPAGPTPARRRGQQVIDVETRLAAGPLGARRDPRRASRPTT